MPALGQYATPDRLKQPDEAGRARARRLYPLEPCEVCGFFEGGQGRVQRHHIDNDRQNNARENIAFLCVQHHNDAHRAGDGRIGGGPRPRVNALRTSRAIAMTIAARQLRADGLLIRQVAAILDVHPMSVMRWFRVYPEVQL